MRFIEGNGVMKIGGGCYGTIEHKIGKIRKKEGAFFIKGFM